MPNRLDNDPLNIVFSGVGGQGNVLSARLLGKAFSEQGYFVAIGETYGASQRGGSVMSHIRVTAGTPCGPLIPLGKANVVVGLEPVETLRVLGDYGNPLVVTVANTREVMPASVNMGRAVYPSREALYGALRELSKQVYLIDATDMALEMGTPIVANFILIGALFGLGAAPIAGEQFEKVLRDNLPPSRLPVNLTAFRKGVDAARGARAR